MKRYHLFLATFLSAAAASAATINVNSLSNLTSALASAAPGDRIILADGTYTNPRPTVVTCKGTPRDPIVIAAETVGSVELTGQAGFELRSPASNVVIQGFKFTHKAGMNLGAGVNHCRVTRNLFELARTAKAAYLTVSGDDNEIDCNAFQNKNYEGQMLSIQGPGGSAMAQHTWVHHNYFYHFRSPGANNCSAIQIGLSGRSMASAFSVVEYNLFVQTAGENEGAICNKSCDNIYRYNTFGQGTTELSLRHGNRCQVYGNFFFRSDGIRFFGKEHMIYNNYFEGCRLAICVGNGDGEVPPAKLTSHDRPVSVRVVFNTLVSNQANVVMLGRSGGGLGATNITFANNIIVGGGKGLSILGPMLKPTWESNLIWTSGGAGDIPPTGFRAVDPKLDLASPGHYHLLSGSPAIASAAGDYTYVTNDIDRQPRTGKLDIGADQSTSLRAVGPNRILTSSDVGPNAQDRR
jgi:poly(beta-D-mannuronate) lyase